MGQIFVAFSEYLNFKVISSEKYYTKMFDTQQEDRNVGSVFKASKLQSSPSSDYFFCLL